VTVLALLDDIPALYLVLGVIGQLAFTGRFVVQWLVSEKRRESVVPVLFWWMSLVGTVFMLVYVILRRDPPHVLLFSVNLGIYVRNLVITRVRRGLRVPLKLVVPVLTGAIVLGAMAAGRKLHWDSPWAWLLCGFAGQTLWNCRFVIQWIVSERRGESVLPTAFWWVSLAGTAFLLPYSINLGDPILILAYLFTPVVYVRNLMLVRRSRRGRAQAADPEHTGPAEDPTGGPAAATTR
jgi:lipid-A-disaccharide synthase-like uncharacterized protein